MAMFFVVLGVVCTPPPPPPLLLLLAEVHVLLPEPLGWPVALEAAPEKEEGDCWCGLLLVVVGPMPLGAGEGGEEEDKGFG